MFEPGSRNAASSKSPAARSFSATVSMAASLAQPPSAVIRQFRDRMTLVHCEYFR
jgi:hypothetical protein